MVTAREAMVFGATPLVTRVAIGVCRLGPLGDWHATRKQTKRWSISHDQGIEGEIRESATRNACAESPPGFIYDYYSNVTNICLPRRL